MTYSHMGRSGAVKERVSPWFEHCNVKPPTNTDRGAFLEPGDDLLSHGETPHYHRRCIVSLLSSGWIQVVPMLYGRQANWLG